MWLSAAFAGVWPIVLTVAAILALRWYFRDTWRDLDVRARSEAARLQEERTFDTRPLVALTTAAFVFSVQQYFGGFAFYSYGPRPVLEALDAVHPWIRFVEFDDLYALGWWVLIRVLGFVLVPLVVSRASGERTVAATFGLDPRDFTRHLGITAAVLGLAVPFVWLASRDSSFAAVYPNYRNASRSGIDLLLWEVLYVGQFLALEMFLRGWLMRMLGGLGSAAIFAITVPYCMMHFAGKPYSETVLSIAAGIALGSLAAKTKAIWHGFVMHAGVAVMMDALSLVHRGG